MESLLYKEKSESIKVGLKKMVDETLAGLDLEILVTSYGEGIRACLIRVEKRGVTPIATACASSLQAPVKDIVHGLWGSLCVRSRDEVRHLKSEKRKLVRK